MIIIDAYNLIHKIPELRILLKQSQDVCVDTMVSKLMGHFHGKKVKVVLVFDGSGKNRSLGRIEVKFSSTHTGYNFESADVMIKHLIEKVKNPKLVMVVSSDKGITWFAKDCGCKIQTAESFWGGVKEKRTEMLESARESKEKPDIVTKGEFDYLLKEFNRKK